MPKLIGYMTMSVAGANGTNDGYLVKAVCSFCGKKYGSLEEARKCETRCLNALIRQDLKSWICNNVIKEASNEVRWSST